MLAALLALLFAAAEPAEFWQQGLRLYKAEQWTQAAESFRQALKGKPGDSSAFAMLGLCEWKSGRYLDALTHLQAAEQAGLQGDIQFRQVVAAHIGLSLLEAGDFEGSHARLSALAESGLKSESVTEGLGLAALRIRYSRRPDPGTEARAAVVAVGDVEALGARGDTETALKTWAQVADEYPAVPNLYHARGKYLQKLRRYQEAIASFETEIRQQPNHILARLAIAEIQLPLNAAEGLRYAREAVALNEKVPAGRYLLGMLLVKSGQLAEGIKELETARALLPGESRVHFALARAYALAGRPQDAAASKAEYGRLQEGKSK